MSFQLCLDELRSAWFPNVTDTGLKRLIDLLDKGSPLLIHGSFARAATQGCIATHVAWNHPATEWMDEDAGVRWLTRVAGLNPATSHVLNAWDGYGSADWALRCELLEACKTEQYRRSEIHEIA